LLLGGSHASFTSFSGSFGASLEFIDTAFDVYNALLAGKERVRGAGDVHFNKRVLVAVFPLGGFVAGHSGASQELETVVQVLKHHGAVVGWVNVFLHNLGYCICFCADCKGFAAAIVIYCNREWLAVSLQIMSQPEGNHPIFDPASEAARCALVRLTFDTLMEAEERSLTSLLSVGPSISVGEGHRCIDNSEKAGGVGFMDRVAIDDIQALAPQIQRDAESFPRAAGWHAAALLTARAVMAPDEIFPVHRDEFTYIALRHPHREINGGVFYVADDGTKAQVDSNTPEADGFGMTNFTVDLWIGLLHEYRKLHDFPPLEGGAV